MARYTDAYIDRLISSKGFLELVELQGIFFGWSGCDFNLPNFGFHSSVFTFNESLTWFSQAIRSGVWTYYEATPIERQEAMFAALQIHAPIEFSKQYKYGIEHWKDVERIESLDSWIEDNEFMCNEWLFDLLLKNRHELSTFYA